MTNDLYVRMMEYHPMRKEWKPKIEDNTNCWCLFVSKEVYGLEWDWEKSCWKEAK